MSAILFELIIFLFLQKIKSLSSREILKHIFNDKPEYFCYTAFTRHKLKAGCCCKERTAAVVYALNLHACVEA
jgi:hypothetical protein